jgi:hypothetical protein
MGITDAADRFIILNVLKQLQMGEFKSPTAAAAAKPSSPEKYPVRVDV